MLTDYHVHLRSDGIEHRAEDAFTAANAERYQEVAAERGIETLGVSEHVHRFRQALRVWDHPFWRQNAVDDLDAYCEFVRDETSLALGIEADFVAAAEDRMANLLEEQEWDYVIGSFHFLGGAALGQEGEWDVWRDGEPDRVWRRYLEVLGGAARSGLSDSRADPDLGKVWSDEGRVPRGGLRFYCGGAVDGLANSAVAIEIWTAG